MGLWKLDAPCSKMNSSKPKPKRARATEVSGSVNFGDKFHEVHFGRRSRARAHLRTRNAYRIATRGSPGATRNSRKWESPLRLVALDSMSRSIEITFGFHARIRSSVAHTLSGRVREHTRIVKLTRRDKLIGNYSRPRRNVRRSPILSGCRSRIRLRINRILPRISGESVNS